MTANGGPKGVPPAQALAAIALTAIASLALSLAIGQAQEAPEQATESEASLGVEWAFRPTSLGDLVSHSQAIVLARVIDVRAGEPQEAEGQSIPTQRIDVAVERSFAGRAPDRLEIFKLGGEGMQPEGAPDYAPGERYLLFVRRRLNDELTAPHPDGTWILTAPDGRLREPSSGRLTPLIAGPVADRLDGDTATQAAAEATATGAKLADDPIEAER